MDWMDEPAPAGGAPSSRMSAKVPKRQNAIVLPPGKSLRRRRTSCKPTSCDKKTGLKNTPKKRPRAEPAARGRCRGFNRNYSS